MRQSRKIQKQDIEVPPFAKSIKPGTNFFGYINANWIRHVNTPSYMSSYSISEEIQSQIEPSLEKIIQNAQTEIVNNPNKIIDKDTLLIGNLEQSIMDRGSQDLSIKFVKNLVSNIRCIRNREDIAISIGEFSKFHIPSPITVYTGPEEKHSSQLRLILRAGELTLENSSYYTKDIPGRTRTLALYTSLLTRLGNLFDVSNLNLFISIEKIIAEAHEKTFGDTEILMKGIDLKNEYPDIPWDQFALTAFNFTPSHFNEFKFLIYSQTWFKNLNIWFKTWPIDNWRILLSGLLIMYSIPLLPSPYSDYHFEFFQKHLRGQTKKIPQKKLGLKACKQWLYVPLGKQYVSCCVPQELKADAMLIAKEIIEACLNRLQTVEWLDVTTRKKAIKKVSNIHLGIAYPSKFQESPKVILSPENFVKNIFSLGQAEFLRDLKRANTKLDVKKWDDSVFEVNAYYYNEGNRLVIPSGILRYPFFDINSSDGWNFGGIGATIGHEITHAFDMDGKDYDEFGNNKPWWSESDNDNYYEKTKSIIALYNKTKYFNQYINGNLTLSENIADLGGVALSLMALKARLVQKQVSKKEYFREVCNFFISYAVSWRVKEKREKAIQSIITDMHAPPITRVNNIVRQFDDWYECFDVKPGNVLYTSPEDRIRIF